MSPTRVVPGLDPLEVRLGELLAALPVVFVEQLELERANQWNEPLGLRHSVCVADWFLPIRVIVWVSSNRTPVQSTS